MGIRTCKPREFNWASGENPFAWLVEETSRIRHYNSRYGDEGRFARSLANRPAPCLVSLRSHKGNAVLLNQLQKPRTDAPTKNVFEISKARKL